MDQLKFTKVRSAARPIETDPIARMYPPERCPECGEAWTPGTLKAPHGGKEPRQCRHDG